MKPKQHRTAHGCLQVLAAFVVVIFVLTAVPITLIASLTNTITNRENIKSIVSVDGFVREFMVQGIEADIRQSYAELNAPFPGVNRRGIENAVDLVVPQDWVDNALNAGIDNIYNFLENGRTDDYILDVAPLINGLQSESGREAMTIIVSHYPPCPTAEIPPIVYEERNVEITCIPASVPVNQFADQIHRALAEGLANDPELKVNGGVEPIKWSEMDPMVVEDILATYDVIDSVWLAWLVPLVLLLLITILAVRSYYSMGIWFGWPLLLTGILIPIPALWLSFQYSRLLQMTISEMGVPENEFGQIATSLMFNAAYALRNIWLGNVLLQAGLMFLLGAGGIFLAFYLRRKKPKSQSGGAVPLDVNGADYA